MSIWLPHIGALSIPSDPTILWTTFPITDTYFDYINGPNNGFTFTNNLTPLGYGTSLGHFVLDHYDIRVPVIDHSYVTGEYIYKYDVVSVISGDAALIEMQAGLTGQEGIWYPLITGSYVLVKDAATADAVVTNIVIDITIAKDNGAGAPVAGTAVTKRCTAIVYRGTSADYIARDNFTGTNGTNLTAHAMDNGGLSWVAHAGTIQITTNRAVATGAGDNRYVMNAGNANCCLVAELKVASSECGLIGRAVDANNYWHLKLTAADTANPVLSLYEVVAGTPTLRDSVIYTGLGPISTTGDSYLRLMFDGDDIYGDAFISWMLPEGTSFQLNYNSATFNTATLFGISLATTATTVDLIRITTKEIGLLT